MAKIPQSFIDELLAKTDIVAVIERYIPLKKKGANYSALCPFHNEKSPSFTVSAQKQFFYCFGCGASGNAIGFVMDYERLNFPEAVEQLAQQAGMPVPKTDAPVNPDFQSILDILEKATKFYQAQLYQHAEAKRAQAYLQKRGLTTEIANQFRLGFAPSGWDHLLRALPKEQAYLSKAGLLSENDQGRTYDRFRDRLMFPIRDRRGRVIGFGGRVLDQGEPKYLNSPETPVFHKGKELYGLYEARQANLNLSRLIVVEGYMDVISLAQHGITNAVATLGTAVTADHIRRLITSAKEIVFCFDGDLAGQKAAWKAVEIALPQLTEQVQLKFIFMPATEDPDSYIRQQGKAAFDQLIETAMPLSDFFFDHCTEQVNMESIEGRSTLIALTTPYIQQVTAPITKELLMEKLAQLAHIPLEKIHTWSEHTPFTEARQKRTPEKPSPIRLAISLILHYPHAASQTSVSPLSIEKPGIALLQKLLELVRINPNITTGTLIEHWRGQPEAAALAKLVSAEIFVPETGATKELNEIFNHINKLAIENEIDSLFLKNKESGLDSIEKDRLHKLLRDKNTGF